MKEFRLQGIDEDTIREGLERSFGSKSHYINELVGNENQSPIDRPGVGIVYSWIRDPLRALRQ